MKQGKLGEELGKTPMQIGKIRKEICDDDEYNQKTGELSESAVQKIRDYCDDKAIEPQYTKAKIIEFPNNPRFVICRTLEGTESKKTPVCVPSNIKKSLRLGHVIRCQVITYEGMDYYRHEKLVDGYYPSIPKKA